MKKKNLLFISVIFLLAALGLALWAIPRLPEFQQALAERIMNDSAREHFDGSLRVEKVAFDRHFKLHIAGISGNLKTRQGSVPLEVVSLDSQESLFLLISQKPVRFVFEGVRPQGTSRRGISGNFTFQTGSLWRFELEADFSNTGLEDWQWLDPANLEGATGATRGRLTFRQIEEQEPEFSLDLEAPEPGGHIQARFFDIFLPYLPVSLQKERVRKMSQSQKVIGYRNAVLQASLPQGDRMKILLQIFIPDYNLKLSLNMDLRTDSKNAFSQIARILGLIEVK